jgi:hypothetical protein
MNMKSKIILALFILGLAEVSLIGAGERPVLTEQEGGFSYTPPEGWQIAELPGLKFKISRGEPSNGFAPNMNVVDEAFSGKLDDYVEGNLKALEKIFKDFKKISNGSFETKAGIKGGKLVTQSNQQGMILQQTFYFFERKDGKKLVVTCSVLAADGAKFADIFDESMKTFSLSK